MIDSKGQVVESWNPTPFWKDVNQVVNKTVDQPMMRHDPDNFARAAMSFTAKTKKGGPEGPPVKTRFC